MILVTVTALIIALMLVISAWGWTRIPAGQPVAIHWGLNSQPDRYASRAVALLVLPVIAIVLAFFLGMLMAALESAPREVLALRATLVMATAVLCLAHAFVVGVGARNAGS